MITEEDRISNLQDDIIHHILSFIDLKYAIQTSVLSHRWKHIWTSMHHLNLNSRLFCNLACFAEFVKQAISNRNSHSKVSTLKFQFSGSANQDFVNRLVNYAYSHNVTQLNMLLFSTEYYDLPQYLVSSRTLKHLTITLDNPNPFNCFIPESTWDFPALETLYLSGFRVGFLAIQNINLFSKCVNLKDLTLHKFHMSRVNIFNICAPQLSNLTITDVLSYPKVFNLAAPHLKNFTAPVIRHSLFYIDFLKLTTPAFSSLNEVNLSSFHKQQIGFRRRIGFRELFDLFQKLSSAKFLILDLDVIETLSTCLDQLSHEPCPFDNLKCLKINNMPMKQKDDIITIPIQIRNYFLEKSPSATIIMDLPQCQMASSSSNA